MLIYAYCFIIYWLPLACYGLAMVRSARTWLAAWLLVAGGCVYTSYVCMCCLIMEVTYGTLHFTHIHVIHNVVDSSYIIQSTSKIYCSGIAIDSSSIANCNNILIIARTMMILYLYIARSQNYCNHTIAEI